MRLTIPIIALTTLLTSCAVVQPPAKTPVGERLSNAKFGQGHHISWQEHIIDGPALAGFALTGGDGLVMADIDGDGFEDIVSVHESDAEYDSAVHTPGFVPEPAGHVRIAFGTANPNRWVNITLAEGSDTPAPEDAAIADVNGDGYLDVVVATELSHLLYLQNPGAAVNGATIESIRHSRWARLVLPMTKDRGSYIRVFLADFNGDGKPEIVAANKGSQTPGPNDYKNRTAVSIFEATGDPLTDSGWREYELGRYIIPQNSEPIDIDGDSDLDIIIGSRGESRLIVFENTRERFNDTELHFEEHPIVIDGAQMAGFNLEYSDFNGDGRLDIVGARGKKLGGLVWIEQPTDWGLPWKAHEIGTFAPDILVGLELADIDGDGDADVIGGGYSSGSRVEDGNIGVEGSLGRICWYQNPGKATSSWVRHDISRRQRGMFDKFVGRDLDGDGDIDFVGTRGNSGRFDGVFWLEQLRLEKPGPIFSPARSNESPEVPLP